MLGVQLTENSKVVMEQIHQHLESLNGNKPSQVKQFEQWQAMVQKTLLESFNTPMINQQFISVSKVLPNKFSDFENRKKLEVAFVEAKRYLEELIENIESGKFERSNKAEDVIDMEVVLIIIRRILNNFYKHIEAMYQEDIHGNGSIRKEDLNKIQIGNEYDVQRILYSIIRPIFPEARLEVVDDAGYNSVRYDIVLSQYSIIIEVKCTRSNMTERKLTEELGADAFHYKAEHLFMFIFDKVKLIKNVDAFIQAFTKSKQTDGKDVETIVIQEVRF